MSPPSLVAPTFIGGAGRSGTTLLRVMLDAHPLLRAGPEFKVLPQIAALRASLVGPLGQVMAAHGNETADVDAACRGFVSALTANFVGPDERWVEKTPHNALCMDQLGAIFPDARFLHLVRDGRDVVASLLNQTWLVDGQPVEYTRDARSAARYWKAVVTAAIGQEEAPHLTGRVAEVRYEVLVSDPEAIMRNVLTFIDVPWDDGVLHPEATADRRTVEPTESSTAAASRTVSERAVGRWRTELSEAQVGIVLDEAGDLLEALGYV